MRRLLDATAIVLISLFMMATPEILAVTVEPEETNELLKNPGIGWMTMFKPAINDSNLPTDIPSSVYYVRLNWESIHINSDKYDWSSIDKSIVEASEGGQQIILRLMPVWHKANSPIWMRDLGAKGYYCELDGSKWVADLDDPVVQSLITSFLEAMGKRYDKHPQVYAIEINFLGVYGEGHFNECPRVPMPKKKTQQWLVDEHYKFFPTLPILGPIDASMGKYTTHHMYQQYGNTRGAGVFMDAWGDYKQWNHMDKKYPEWLSIIHGNWSWDSWVKGPVKLEPSGVMNDWPLDIPRALRWAEKMHASLIGNKNAIFPSMYKSEIQDALKRVGYRLVLKRFEHADTIAMARSLAVTINIENIGVAPPYRDYNLAIRFKSFKVEKTVVTNQSVKFWIPGRHALVLSVPIPDDLSAGDYSLALGIVDPYSHHPAIQMPIAGRETNGWHALSRLTVTPAQPTENHKKE